MKAIRTWVLLANARQAHVMSYDIARKRLLLVEEAVWTAEPPSEYADEAGVVQSRAGPGRASISRTDPALFAEAAFAKTIVSHLSKACDDGQFDKLIIVAAPHMLGVLRTKVTPHLQPFIHEEVDKDLTQAEPEKVQQSLAAVLSP